MVAVGIHHESVRPPRACSHPASASDCSGATRQSAVPCSSRSGVRIASAHASADRRWIHAA
jgi:hypothetical protein